MGDKITCTDVPVDASIELAAVATRQVTSIATDSVSITQCADSASAALRRQRTLADVVRGVFGLPSRYGLTESDREELAAWIDGLATPGAKGVKAQVKAGAVSGLLTGKTPATGSGAQMPCIARRARAG